MKIGERVATYRESHGMSQREFARKCGLSSVIISYLERGERSNGDPYLPKFDTIRKIARGMGTTAEKLISECEDFELNLSVGMEETPIYEDFTQSQSADEMMLLQAYRMIPIEHRIEAMQLVFEVMKKYEN